MKNTRVKVQSIVENQLPEFIRQEFPLAGEFLKQYYISQEHQSSPSDIIQNIDNYIKLDSLTNITESTSLTKDVKYYESTIEVFTPNTITPTAGFPDKYGLIKIGDEIISYEYRTSRTFEGCKRGFSGVYEDSGELIFSETFARDHSENDAVINLSVLFLKQFLLKIKNQFLPGFSDRDLFSEKDTSTGFTSREINENIFIKQSKDFYSSKGTDESFKILFAALYGERVEVIKPRDYLFIPSNAGYRITKDIVVEALEGNPLDLLNKTLYQDEYDSYDIPKSYAAITDVEKIQIKDRVFYKLSFDADFNRDIILDGIQYGNFDVHPKTKVTSIVSSGSSVITVDSTIGFPTTGGVLSYISIDGIESFVSYTNKSVTEFYGVSGILNTIPENTDIRLDVDAYGYPGVNTEEKIRVRIGSVLEEFIFDENAHYYEKNDSVKIKSLGISNPTAKRLNWIDNISNTYNIKNIRKQSSNKIFIETYDPHNLRIGDVLEIIDSASSKRESVITDVLNSKSISISGSWNIESILKYKVRKKITKCESNVYPHLNEYSANIQNTYTRFNGDILVASSSLPYYYNQPIDPHTKKFVLDGSYSGETVQIVKSTDIIKDHGLFTGDAIYYRPYYTTEPSEFSDGVLSSFETLSEGVYYVYRVNSTSIKICKSKSDIFESKFINVSGTVTNNLLEFYPFSGKSLEPQNIFKEVLQTSDNHTNVDTLPGNVGIFINGTELLNYKSKDTVFYGSIESITVESPGKNYDVINRPELIISDPVGTGASAILSVQGSLEKINILDQGFDYVTDPKIEITGGNGTGARVQVNTTLKQHSVSVNVEDSKRNLNFINGTIGFSTYHKFRDAEEVIYVTEGQSAIVGLTTNSSYYVYVVDEKTIKLHKTKIDAISGINTVSFTNYGSGVHEFKTLTKKRLLSSIRVIDPGFGYTNNERRVSSSTSGINTASNTINIISHGYSNLETITYSSTETPIGGLSTTSRYLVTKIDDDNFKLSNIGVGSTAPDFYYHTNQYVNFSTKGTGIHIFNYPSIEVKINGLVGVSTRSGQDFTAKIEPVFKGSVISTQIVDSGNNYGSPNIINYNREPIFEIRKGSGAQVKPIINDGKIVEVLVVNGGEGYTCPPELVVYGNGKYQQLVPILTNGVLTEVRILNGGTGHDSSTSILVEDFASDCALKANIQKWTVNLFEKNFNTTTPDDGVLQESLYNDDQLQYSHLYSPRKLREYVYSKDSEGNLKYGVPDLRKQADQEIDSSDHSPIIGWAYDGNPIYGPYGYSTATGGSVRLMKSGYTPTRSPNRPPYEVYKEGFFVEDYVFTNSGDLDEHNGRYCITPDYPNGVYAYFTTINLNKADTDGPFIGYKRPIFPYVIGNKFKSVPNPINLSQYSSQLEYVGSGTKWFRNTVNYNFNKSESSYEFVYDPNYEKNQNVNIDFSSPGSITDLKIIYGGDDYKVNDKVVFNNDSTGGYNAIAKVYSVGGKPVEEISSSTQTLSDVEFSTNYSIVNGFTGVTTVPHNLSNLDLINVSGFNTSFSSIEGVYRIGVTSESYVLTIGIGSTGLTGITTYFYLNGNLNNIRENDIFNINSEKIKVLNIDSYVSRLRVLRCYDNTVGTSHSAGDILYENSRKFNFAVNNQITNSVKYIGFNREFYFNPKESVGLGTTSGVGITSTLIFSVPGIGKSQVSIPTRSIYLPNHTFVTGQSVVYNSNVGSPLIVSNNGIGTFPLTDGSTLYIAKINSNLIGISTVKIGLSTEGNIVGVGTTTNSGLLYFTSHESGTYHSFKTVNSNSIFGQASKTTVTVSTATTHGLSKNSIVGINLYPNDEQLITVQYNSYNRRIVFDPQSFVSADVDIDNNTIKLEDHELHNGDKVIHTSDSPCGGLVHEKIYYVNIFNKDRIRLCNTYFDAIKTDPEYVQITSASTGTIFRINPSVKSYTGKVLKFDLSHSSLSNLNNTTLYSAFDLKFYTDFNFQNEFKSSFTDTNFEVVKSNGRVGIDTTAYVSIQLSLVVPKKLYYKFETINKSFVSDSQKEIYIDSEVRDYNAIVLKSSDYVTNEVSIVGVGSTTFDYQLQSPPEKTLYTKNNSSISYVAFSTDAKGPIGKINLISGGKNYYRIPSASVKSVDGSGAILEPSGYSIGKLQKYSLEDIGFDYPSDFTLAPVTNLPEILKIEPLSSFSYIGISSGGKNYLTNPSLVVIDGYTNKIVNDVDLVYNLGETQVRILKNTYGLYNTKPRIIPVNNTNGVGISSISYNSSSKEVTIGFSTGFSDVFPFSVGDKVLVENVSVGVNTTGKGYNSENYNYSLFTLTEVNESLGGNTGSVVYKLTSDLLSDDEYPGTFDPSRSYGRIIAEKDFPTFNPVLVKNDFIIGEPILVDNNEVGKVNSWNNKNEYLKVSTSRDIAIGSIVSGRTSRTKGLVSNKLEYNSYIQPSSSSRVVKGWKYETGFLNNSNQRLHDNFYYQYFSYSIKSKVSYENWKDSVNSLNHTSGFLKFSDLSIESKPIVNKNNNSSDSVANVVVDIIGQGDLNCFYNFDLASEVTFQINSKPISTEIIFETTVISDYFESIGNRVLLIDDIGAQFNSNPRSTRYQEVSRFGLDTRFKKYFTYARDRRYTNERQSMIVTLLYDNNQNFILNQYGRLETLLDLGSFDAQIIGTEGILNFYPNKYSVNNYDVSSVSYSIKDSFVGTGTSSFGVAIVSSSSTVSPSIGSTCTIVSIANTYSSVKALVEITGNDGQYEFDELSLVSDGTNVEILEYGQISNTNNSSYVGLGLGTYHSYIDGSITKVDFIPNSGIGVTVNTLQVSIGNTLSSGIGTHYLKNGRLGSSLVSIAASTSPVSVNVAEYNEVDNDIYDGSYFIVQVSDVNSGNVQLSEVLVIDDDSEVYYTEYGILTTENSLGTIGAAKTDYVTHLTFTPNPDIDVEVRTFYTNIRNAPTTGDTSEESVIDLTNSYIESDHGIYFGTNQDVRSSFELTHQNKPIFKKVFDGSNSEIVDVDLNTITIPGHFFTNGEEVVYSNTGGDTKNAIGIGTTVITGIGTTDKLPSSVYVIKVNELKVKLASSAENALKLVPEELDLVHVGIGTTHSFVSKKQNSKVILTVDNMIQSPIVSTAITTLLSRQLTEVQDVLYFDNVDSFYGSDLIKIDDEIMRISTVGFGSTNAVYVQRPWMGTTVVGHSTGAVITKIHGNYNIIENTVHFVDPPYGNTPIGTSSNSPNERDWTGITTSSKFHGRVFLKNGILLSSQETYSNNYILDDISEQFTGIGKTFTITSENQNVSGISTGNAIVLVNGVFQYPQGSLGSPQNYSLIENTGITSITFVGNEATQDNDINSFSNPVGGIIVSVGSSFGFGYQPLVSAGGTAIVSTAGTISAISIGNSGSGYRSGIQTVVNVGVQTYSLGVPNIEFIGTASVSNGHVVSVAITNPGTGYTSTNPPIVVFDSPLNYSNIPLIYEGSSGSGSNATINIVVGQGSSVINFSINNSGYGYKAGEVLTVATGGSTGIPTDSTKPFELFKINVDRTFTDNFSGWTVGDLQTLDSFDEFFDGSTRSFGLKINTIPITIKSSSGSNIDIKSTILVFLNDILQIPEEAYRFSGGSRILFTEPPKEGDKCRILFYKGNGDTDVVFRDIIETVKEGDTLQLNSESSLGLGLLYQQDPRVITGINTADSVNTNPYFYPGLIEDRSVLRPITWCKQKSDVFIDGRIVSKSRVQYEPQINPTTRLIKSVGIGSTEFFVENVRPFFDPLNENLTQSIKYRVEIISQDTKVAASATSIVSAAGTVTSISIDDGGSGYLSSPEVSIENPVGLGTTSRAYAVSSVHSGVVTSITITNSGTGYTSTNPPNVLIEYPKYNTEKVNVYSYEGDFGLIVGISTDPVGVASTEITFDLFIPDDSYLKNSEVTEVTAISGIQTGYYFVAYNTNVGSGVTSLDNEGNVLGIGSQYLDNVYQVSSVSLASTSVPGYGTTTVSKVTVSVSDHSSLSLTGLGNTSFLGNYSWGRILTSNRTEDVEYKAYSSNGILGVSTSDVIRRISPLKYVNYTS